MAKCVSGSCEIPWLLLHLALVCTAGKKNVCGGSGWGISFRLMGTDVLLAVRNWIFLANQYRYFAAKKYFSNFPPAVDNLVCSGSGFFYPCLYVRVSVCLCVYVCVYMCALDVIACVCMYAVCT